MKKRMIAGRAVGAVGLGCMSFGGMYGATSRDESHACLQASIELGADYWDVAEIYGNGHCETVMGEFLAQSPADVFIATKAGIYFDGVRYFSNSADRLRASLEGSLKRLGRDRVELFYIHRREAECPVEEVMETLAGFHEEGMIGAAGLSEVAPHTIRRAHAVFPVAAVQSEYSLWTRLPDLGVRQTCAELGIALVAFSPVARGMLTDTTPVPAAFPKGDFRAPQPRFQEPNFSQNVARVDMFRDFCRSRGWSTAAAAIAWTLDQGEHVIPIPGTRNASHLRELVAGADIAFTEADRQEIERLLPVGWAHGDRYSEDQLPGAERYC